MPRMDRVRNEAVRRSLGQEAVLDIVKEKQRRWKVKVEEIDGDRLVKQVYEEGNDRKETENRPRKRWTDNFK